MNRKEMLLRLRIDIRDALIQLGDSTTLKKAVFELPFIIDASEASLIDEQTIGTDWRVRFSPKLKLKPLKQMTTVTLIKNRKLLK